MATGHTPAPRRPHDQISGPGRPRMSRARSLPGATSLSGGLSLAEVDVRVARAVTGRGRRPFARAVTVPVDVLSLGLSRAEGDVRVARPVTGRGRRPCRAGGHRPGRRPFPRPVTSTSVSRGLSRAEVDVRVARAVTVPVDVRVARAVTVPVDVLIARVVAGRGRRPCRRPVTGRGRRPRRAGSHGPRSMSVSRGLSRSRSTSVSRGLSRSVDVLSLGLSQAEVDVRVARPVTGRGRRPCRAACHGPRSTSFRSGGHGPGRRPFAVARARAVGGVVVELVLRVGSRCHRPRSTSLSLGLSAAWLSSLSCALSIALSVLLLSRCRPRCRSSPSR